MDYYKTFLNWRDGDDFDAVTRSELSEINDLKEIEDRFYKELEFGTGGLRGLMGAGTNRINIYTIGRATYGIGRYLIDLHGEDFCKASGVVIAYDTRNNSKTLADIAAKVLSSFNIPVYLNINACPTPELSFSVKKYNCMLGIVITASHNPKEYNGYKVYDANGCQVPPGIADVIYSYIKNAPDYANCLCRDKFNEQLIYQFDCEKEFVDSILMGIPNQLYEGEKEIKIVYTPLHGTGNRPVQRILKKAGFSCVVVCEQADDNGNFPTVITPNPEDQNALKCAISLAAQTKADVVMGTDPDCDRIGIAVKNEREYVLLTGNQIGALILDYLLQQDFVKEIDNPAVVSTIVSSDLGLSIASAHGITVFSTLTGFKYIGEKINQFENTENDECGNRKYSFLFGYEESYGFLFGTHARDKDAVSASLLIACMVEFYRKKGLTLVQRLDELYRTYGYYLDSLDSYVFTGKSGAECMRTMMNKLRNEPNIFDGVDNWIDYMCSQPSGYGTELLPCSNVVKYVFSDKSWIVFRPSGTEPKMKIYYCIKGDNRDLAQKKLANYKRKVQEIIDLFV